MAEIALTRGYVAIVDDEDCERLSRRKWHATAQRYVYAACYDGGEYIHMHREVLGLRNGESNVYTDHINGNTLDNRKANLRTGTCSQNLANAGRWAPRSAKAHSRYKGVCRTPKGRWRAYAAKNRKQIHLGHFDTEEEAARARDAAAIELWGEFARLNFPEQTKEAS